LHKADWFGIGSGVGFLWRKGEYLNKVVGEGFHLLSFDPRGVNGSIPRASCYFDSAQRTQNLVTKPWDVNYEAGDLFVRAENQAKACDDTTGEHGAYINTPQTAADMNSILDAIGQKEMYYWGFSCESSIYSGFRLTHMIKMERFWDRRTHRSFRNELTGWLSTVSPTWMTGTTHSLTRKT